MAAPLSRRRLLAASTATAVVAVAPGSLLVGCTTDPARPRVSRDARAPSPPATPDASEPPGPDPDVVLLGEVVDGNRSLVQRYQDVLDRHPGLSEGLRPLLAAHRAHGRALGDAAPDGTPSPGTPTKRPDVATPRRPDEAVRDLRTVEQQTAQTLREQAQRARSGAFARLLASLAASSAQHAQVLGEVRT